MATPAAAAGGEQPEARGRVGVEGSAKMYTPCW